MFKHSARGDGTHRLFRLCRVTLVPFIPGSYAKNSINTKTRPQVSPFDADQNVDTALLDSLRATTSATPRSCMV